MRGRRHCHLHVVPAQQLAKAVAHRLIILDNQQFLFLLRDQFLDFKKHLFQIFERHRLGDVPDRAHFHGVERGMMRGNAMDWNMAGGGIGFQFFHHRPAVHARKLDI